MKVSCVKEIPIEQIGIGIELQNAGKPLSSCHEIQKRVLVNLFQKQIKEGFFEKMIAWLKSTPKEKIPPLSIVWNDAVKRYIIFDGRHRFLCFLHDQTLKEKYKTVPCKVKSLAYYFSD